MVDNKFLKITDRKKEIFKSNAGKYISPVAIENKLKECKFIEHCIVVGEGQKFASALIIPSLSNFKEFCVTKTITYNGVENLHEHNELKSLINNHIKKINNTLAPFEQLKRCQIINANWSVETGEITPKFSLKRKIIIEKNRAVINTIFGTEE
jgi:long-chain acyl-CoA synthetase